MKKWMRLIAVMLLLAMCLSALMACSEESIEDPEADAQDPSAEAPSGGETGDGDTPMLLDPSQAMILASDKTTDYVIIRDDAASDSVKAMINSFRNQFWAKTKADIKVKDDKETQTSKEIIISMMDGRTQPAQEYAKLNVPNGKGYRISIVGESIVVASQAEYLQEALNLLAKAICDCGNGIWGVPKEYEGKLDLPKLPTGKLYDVGQSNYAYNATGVTSATIDGYMKSLNDDGFEVYSEHSVGTSKFFTYVKDSIYGHMVVHTMYHPSLKSFRLTYGPMEYLPDVKEQAADVKADPTITQMYMQLVDSGLVTSGPPLNIVEANNGAPGMSYLIQLSDGRFIILDGGKADGQFQLVTYKNGLWVADEASPSSDGKRLYDTMVSMKPSDHAKPQIALWYLSHAHGDHYGLANQFLTTYQNKIELELVAFTIPASADLADANEQAMNTFKNNAQKNYNAEFWTMHTGQVMELPGATIEVLTTVEDVYCGGDLSKLTDINNTCSVIRIHIGEMSFMVLGDAYPVAGEFMAAAYGDALQSDIMQLAHHGFNGGVKEMYQLVDPKICLWPCDEFRYQTDGRNLGTSGGYDFNYWLRNSKWKRGNSTGARKHYSSSYITTIDANTGAITKK